jgi:hypothetical protein
MQKVIPCLALFNSTLARGFTKAVSYADFILYNTWYFPFVGCRYRYLKLFRSLTEIETSSQQDLLYWAFLI